MCCLFNGMLASHWDIPTPHPQNGAFFQSPFSPGFSEAQDPQPRRIWISKIKDPPPPGFPGKKNIRLKFNLFLQENTHNHV